MGFPLLTSQGATVVTPAYDQSFTFAFSATVGATTGEFGTAPTDICTFNLPASPTQVARLKRLRVNLVPGGTSSVTPIAINVIRRSANNTASSVSTITLVTAAAMDPKTTSPVAITPQLIPTVYASTTGAPAVPSTYGTFLGFVDSQVVSLGALTTGPGASAAFNFSTNLDQAPTLRTAPEQIAINLGTVASNGTTAGALPAGCIVTVQGEWEESVPGGT